MIICKNVSKSYGTTSILSKFHYCFPDRGLYVLFGDSGSGKTTFLNILLGLIPFEEGTIMFDGMQWSHQVDENVMREQVAYITQDPYFVDYLTVEENLRVCAPDKTEASWNALLKQFHIENIKKQYPKELSGGERQRLAIVQALLKEKKILFLDEPSSSLDEQNRTLLFQLLGDLKKQLLIICATHDEGIFEYQDEKIDFNHLEKLTEHHDTDFLKPCETRPKKEKQLGNSRLKPLFRAIFQQWTYPKKEKKSSIFLLLVFLLCLLTCFACYNYKGKLLSALIDQYQVNGIQITCAIDQQEACEQAIKKYSSSALITYNYILNSPEEEGLPEGGVDTGMDFELRLHTIPFEKQYFPIEVAYGSYFTKPNQIILGYQQALDLAQQYQLSLENLLGRYKTIQLPDKLEKFEIIGIFAPITKEEKIYLDSIMRGTLYDQYMYINHQYVEKYKNDDVLGLLEQVNHKIALTVFFTDQQELLKFRQAYLNVDRDFFLQVKDFTENFPNYDSKMYVLKAIAYPSVITMIIVSLLFYFQTKRTELHYTEHLFSVYQYYGYTNKEIAFVNTIFYLASVSLLFVMAFMISVPLVFIANIILTKFQLIPFPLFMIDWVSTFLIYFALLFCSFLLSCLLFYKIKKLGWFHLLKKRSDLL